jgi:hypothetical protein
MLSMDAWLMEVGPWPLGRMAAGMLGMDACNLNSALMRLYM